MKISIKMENLDRVCFMIITYINIKKGLNNFNFIITYYYIFSICYFQIININ